MNHFAFDSYTHAMNYLKYLSQTIGFRPAHHRDGIPVHGDISPQRFVEHVQALREWGFAPVDVRHHALLEYAEVLGKSLGEQDGAA